MFGNENDFEYVIWLKVFLRILKKYTPRKASLYFFFTKNSYGSNVGSFMKGGRGEALSRSQNDKTSNI